MAKTSLFCQIGNNNKCRKAAIRLIEYWWFEHFITLCIILNSVSMSFLNYQSDNSNKFENKGAWFSIKYQTSGNRIISIVDNVIGIVYIIEAIIRIFALGFIDGQNTYLRSFWNIFDFIILISSLAEILSLVNNLRVMRVIRLLRPLKSLKTLQPCKIWFAALFLTFVLLVVSIVGFHQFNGSLQYGCRIGRTPSLDGRWVRIDSGSCNKCLADFDHNSFCGSLLDFGLSAPSMPFDNMG